MSHPNEADIARLLAALAEADVRFIVVGGAAAVMHGAPITTEDLDIVHSRTPENVERLLGLLERLDAFDRYDLANRRLRPTREMLLGSGQVNLSTTLGPLDPLCELGVGIGYDELLADAVEMSDGETRVQVLKLEKLIEVKAATGRDKDRLVIPLLVATLEEQTRREASAGGAASRREPFAARPARCATLPAHDPHPGHRGRARDCRVARLCAPA